MGARFNVLLLAVIIVAVVVGIIAGQSQPHIAAAPVPTSTPTPLPPPQPNHVEIVGDAAGSASGMYLPKTLVIHVGQTVTWENLASDDTSVVADNGTFTSDVLDPGQTFHWRPKSPGRYSYTDFLHPDLRGVIIVQP